MNRKESTVYVVAQGRRQDSSRGGEGVQFAEILLITPTLKTTPIYSQIKRHSIQHNYYEGVFYIT